ncbi:hypothetical protein ACHWQZ_G007064 [Mnemiopsis leidyi]
MKLSTVRLALRRFHYKVIRKGSFEPRTHSVNPMAVAAVQVVGGTPAISPSLLFTDSKNKGFLINAGEGIQRMILESPGLRIANITDILATRFDYNTVASIPGISLFRRDQQAVNTTHNPLTVWGTDNLNGFLRTTQLDCFADEVGSDRHLVLKDLKDLTTLGEVTVKTVPLISSHCYVFFLPQKPGNVNKKKLKEMNIPQKMLATLFKTGSVELGGGKVVNKTDLLDPSDPAPVLVVVDAQSEEECKLLSKIDFSSMIDDSKQTLLMMVHFSKGDVVVTDNYRTFMDGFKDIDHLIMCKNPSSRILFDCAQRNAILSSVLPVQKLFESSENFSSDLTNLTKNPETSIALSEHLLKYNIYPTQKSPVGWQRNNVILKKSFNFEAEEKSARVAYNNFISDQKSENPAKKLRRGFFCPEMTFLGTTSTYSSTFRNVSGIFVECQEGFSALLDAGEMTVGQLIRLHGPEKTEELISKLNFLYISHIHFDHCGGSMSVAEYYHKVNKKPLTILCPIRMLPWFKYLSSVFKVPLDLVPLGKIHQDSNIREDLFKKHGVKIELCPAMHTRDSWSIALKSNDWKIAYSGDTLPNSQFVEIGKDCDVLIHEATHQSTLSEDAAKKRHSTVGQAIEIGEQMKAGYTVLTHFSLRYQKLPPFLDENVPDNVVFAHDFMKITKSNIETWCQATGALPLLFPAHYNDLMKQPYYKNKKKL